MASSVLQNFEQVSYGSENLAIMRGAARQLIGDAVATRTLTAKESGSVCQFDRAAGVVYTLPAPVIGMEFEFVATVTVTSNSYKIITNSASVFLLGAVQVFTIATASAGGFAFNGTTHVACTSNGAESGGVIGSRIMVRAISSTQWVISGQLVGSGTVSTPAATS
jgi:hypothetical protein